MAADSKQRQLAGIMPYRFQPGQCGNPKGRPKSKITFTEAMIAKLDEVITDEGKTGMDLLRDSIFAHALKGNPKAMELILERLDPKPQHASIDVTQRSFGIIFKPAEVPSSVTQKRIEVNGNGHIDG